MIAKLSHWQRTDQITGLPLHVFCFVLFCLGETDYLQSPRPTPFGLVGVVYNNNNNNTVRMLSALIPGLLARSICKS
jgi:hypothetical protein